MAAPNTGAAPTQQALLQAIAPNTAADTLAIAGLEQQQQLVKPEVAQQTAYANALAGIQSGQYGIQQQQTGLQQQENTQQAGQNVAQQGFERTGYGLSQQAIGIQGQELGNQQQQLNLSYNNALRSQQDQGAASGTTYTHGQSQAISTLGQQQALQSGALGLQNSLLTNQSQASANTQAGEESNFQFGQEQLSNAQTNLGLIAKANGLSNQQALTMLNFQNQQAGLAGQQQSAQLLSQIGTTALQDESGIGAALAPAGLGAGGK